MQSHPLIFCITFCISIGLIFFPLNPQYTFRSVPHTLKAVHDVVKGGIKVKKSIELVAEISEIYVRNYQNMLADPNYTPDELTAISAGYAKLLSESADVLQDLKNVVNVTGMSLTDAERLAVINNAYKSLLNYRNLVNYYTRKNISVSYLRAKKKNDTDRVLALYGSADERYW